MSGLDKAIKHFGGQRGLAGALGVTPMAITQWKKRGVPPNRAVDIEKVTDGDVPRYMTRPDLFTPPAEDGVAA